jgi:RimJ/RimL family protein N-acetyltransferase
MKMPAHFLEGESVYLRLFEESDISAEYIERINRPDLGRYLAITDEYPATRVSLTRWMQKFEDNTSNLAFAVVERGTNQMVGVVTLSNINWVHRRAEITLIPIEQDFWEMARVTETMRLLVEYAFLRLGLHKILHSSYCDDAERIQSIKRLGFQTEVTARNSAFFDGEFHDISVLGLLHDELVPTSQ